MIYRADHLIRPIYSKMLTKISIKNNYNLDIYLAQDILHFHRNFGTNQPARHQVDLHRYISVFQKSSEIVMYTGINV